MRRHQGEVVLSWHRSATCTGSSCVEVSRHPDGVAVRDSKDPERGYLVYSREEWAAFVAAIKAGEFDDVA